MKNFSFEYTVHLFKAGEKLHQLVGLDAEAIEAYEELSKGFSGDEYLELKAVAPVIFWQIECIRNARFGRI